MTRSSAWRERSVADLGRFARHAAVGHGADAFDLGGDHVAGLEELAGGRTDARGSAGKDQVPGLQRADPREVFHQRRDIEDQIAGAAILFARAVDVANDLEIGRIAELIQRDDRWSDRAKGVKGFAQIEVRRFAMELCHALGDILPAGQACDMVPGIGGCDIASMAAHHNDQLGFPVGGWAEDDHIIRRAGDAVGELRKSWRMVAEFHSGFLGMGAVIQADAKDFGRARHTWAEIFWNHRPIWVSGQSGGHGVQFFVPGDRRHWVGGPLGTCMTFEVIDTTVVDQGGASVLVGEAETHDFGFSPA